MLSFIKKFMTDIEFFSNYTRRSALILRAGLLAMATGLLSGAIPWPAWLPPWIMPVMAAGAGLIGVGQTNRSVAETKLIAKHAETQSLPAIQAEVIAEGKKPVVPVPSTP